MAVESRKGSVSIEAEHIMPVIKRWLYSDQDIFLRELISNGCDAITKYRLIHSGSEESMSVDVTVDAEQKTIRVEDSGIGMTADEVDRYINQVAFSSAAEFMKQFEGSEQKADIIGHFGLGFYSVFMVSDRVEIDTLSCQDDAEPVHWESTDGMSFEMGEGSRSIHGTAITLHISEDAKDFLELSKVREVLKHYCGYMAYPITLFDANAKPWDREVPDGDEKNEDGSPKMKKITEQPSPQQINDTAPLWLKKPADCTDDEYKAFYHKVFSDYNDPLFWVHLNVDYPFNLKGILYFPKLREDFGIREGEIKLFSGQVFVADNIKEIIPEFLMLLRGVIDCPDIPLNVSRSFLQNDGYVKKISAHITKKVADRLTGLFASDRPAYEGYWDDIAPFIRYGCMSDRKFYDQVKSALLYKLTDGTYKTMEEYQTDNKAKTGEKIYYTSDPKRQAASVSLYTQRGIDVAVMDFRELDASFMSFIEYSSGEEKISFARVDADVSGLTEESDEGTTLDADALQKLFRNSLNQPDLQVSLAAMADDELIAVVTEDEQSRRFREAYRMKDMPSVYSLVLNRRNKTVQAIAARDASDETTRLLCEQVWDLARMAAKPLENEEITAFLTRSQKLMSLVV